LAALFWLGTAFPVAGAAAAIGSGKRVQGAKSESKRRQLQRCGQLCVLRERSMGEIEPSSDDASLFTVLVYRRVRFADKPNMLRFVFEWCSLDETFPGRGTRGTSPLKIILASFCQK
jgi:hypothetical protein